MSDNQKILISVLGAVVGHLLLFLLLGLLFATAGLIAPQRSEAASAAAPKPEEVTILLSDLMKQIEVAPKDLTQQYMRTDADQESPVKPQDAPFHSDRNTIAKSELAPDRSSDLDAPTVAGRDDLPFVEIRDRQFVDGEFLDRSAASAPSATMSAAAPSNPSSTSLPNLEQPPAPPAPIRPPSDQTTEDELKSDAPPADHPKEADTPPPSTPAEAETPPDRAAEQETQPDSPVLNDTPVMAQRQESFDTPFAADPVAVAPETPEPDRDAEAKKPTEENAEPAAPETPLPASALPVAKPFLPSPATPAAAPSSRATQSAAASADIPPSPKPPSDAPAFNSETKARSMKGNVDNIGATPSFNVEASVLGRYKKEVTQAVERQWHRYRERNAEFVTYGTLKVKFQVDKNGTPKNLRIVKNEANAVMAEFTLKAVLDADIPAMPSEVSSMLGSGGLEISYDVIVY